MAEIHHTDITIRAPFCTLNDLTDKTERVWLVFHGYGMLAHYFIKKFEVLDPEKNMVVAPQGLSKFYLEGFTGRVGASWMTKEDRLVDIENQYRYVQTVLDTLGDLTGKRLIYFGFSQGAATMGRFAAFAKLPFEKMIIWAGTFPPDIPEDGYDFLEGTEEIRYYTSKEDPFFKEEMIEHQHKEVTAATGIAPRLHWYDGGHKVIADRLMEI